MSFLTGSDSDGSDSAVSSRSPPRYKNLLDTVKSLRRMGEDTRPKKKRKETESYTTLLEFFHEDLKGLGSNNSEEQSRAVCNLGSLLIIDEPPFEEFFTCGVVRQLVGFLSREHESQFQLNALCFLSTIVRVAPQHRLNIVKNGIIPSLVNLLNCTDDDIRKKTLKTLGILAGDSPRHRDIMLNHGALSPLLSLLQPEFSVFKWATWCLSKFFSGKPFVNLDQVRLALPVLQQQIRFNSNYGQAIVANTCWALAYLAECPTSIQTVIELGVCQPLLKLLSLPSVRVTLPAVQIIGNITAGDNVQTQVLIDNSLLPLLHRLLTKEYNSRLFRKVCWTISNITAGTRSQIQSVIDANIIPLLVEILHNDEILHNKDFEVKLEAVRVIVNMTCGGSEENIRFLANQGCIKPFCELLAKPNPTLLILCLEGLENILKVGRADQEKGRSEVNNFAKSVNKCGGIYDKIHNLMLYENEDIRDRASRLFKRIWAEKEFPDLDS